MSAAESPTLPRMSRLQTESLEHFRAYNVPADWYVKRLSSGQISAVAVGEGFVWSFLIDPNGETASSEAPLGDWSTGIEV